MNIDGPDVAEDCTMRACRCPCHEHDGDRPKWVQNVMDGARADVEFGRRSGPHFVKTLLGEIDRLEALVADAEESA